VAVAGILGARGALRRRVAGVHSVSRFVDGTIESHLLAGRRVVRAVIPDFREPGLDDLRPGRSPELPADPYIVYVGALRRVKGIEVLLDAWGGLEPRPPLVLVGTRAPDTPASLPPGVQVVLDASPGAVMDAFDRSLFAVAPSLWSEPLGNVVHEAHSRGRAVVGTTPGGHDDMIDDGVDGLLVAPGDVAALRDAMRRLLADPAEAARMGAAGRRRADRFTAERVVPQFEQLYRQIAAAS
jgi:glycosyltransferase involved in cell wall biosynthesis